MKFLRLALCFSLVACGKLELPGRASEAAPDLKGASGDNRSFVAPSSAAQAFGANDKVYAITSDADAWYIGGSFSAVKSLPTGGLIELGTDGAAVQNCLLDGSFDNTPSAIVATADSIYVGGGFTAYKGQPVRYLAKILRADCSLDATFNRTAPNGFNNYVYSLAIDGGWLYVGGAFTSYDGVAASANRIARLSLTNGAMDSFFGAAGSGNGFDGLVSSLLISGGSLYAAGNFTAYKGALNSAQKVAKLSLTDGSLDPIFGPAGATSNGFSGDVYALAADASSVYVGGRFTAYRGVADSAINIAKIRISDGALDTTFSPPGANNNGFTSGPYQVNALVVSGTSLYAAGNFSHYRGNLESAWRVAKLSTLDGAQDTSFSPPGRANNGFGAEAKALALKDGFLYVGGTFSGYYQGGYKPAARIAKLDAATGALDPTFLNPGSTAYGFASEAATANYAVNKIFVEGNSLFLMGQFTNYGGIVANRFAKVRKSDGAVDLTVSPQGGAPNGFNGDVRSILVAEDALVVGGSYSSYRNIPARGAVFLDKASGSLLSP